MILHRCPNCQELYEGKKCPECSKKQAEKYNKMRYKMDETATEYQESRWKKVREACCRRFMNIDIWRMADGNPVPVNSPIVHHIVERNENPDLFYDLDNLVTVSTESHNTIHKYYKTPEGRKYAVNRILAGVTRFSEYFEGGTK